MAKLPLGEPPALSAGAVYGEYLPWLLERFHDQLCAYCLLRHLKLTVDHYVPQSYDSTRAHDPTNLLPACFACNRGKWDYHPQHVGRRCLASDSTGYLPIDVRSEDLAGFFVMLPNGELRTADPRTADRAAWHATVLLKLDIETWRRERESLCAMLDAAQSLLQSVVPELERAPILNALVDHLASRWLLLEALDFPVDSTLRELIVVRRAQNAV